MLHHFTADRCRQTIAVVVAAVTLTGVGVAREGERWGHRTSGLRILVLLVPSQNRGRGRAPGGKAGLGVPRRIDLVEGRRSHPSNKPVALAMKYTPLATDVKGHL